MTREKVSQARLSMLIDFARQSSKPWLCNEVAAALCELYERRADETPAAPSWKYQLGDTVEVAGLKRIVIGHIPSYRVSSGDSDAWIVVQEESIK